MTKEKLISLEEKARNVRRSILEMSTNGGAFTGSAMSCSDIILWLYNDYLNVNKDNLDKKDRDMFFLSKGHSVPALYSVFAEMGFIEKNRLNSHLKEEDDIYWHPNVNVAGVDFHSGSLGHGLPIGLGAALEMKLSDSEDKVVVLMGDGELNEGSAWEAALVATAHKVDNLILIIDRNKFQANMQTEELIPLGNIAEKFRAFGWGALECNGHDFESIETAFSNVPAESGKPTVIIADTVRGKGAASIEARWDKWFCNFTDEELKRVLEEVKD